MYHYHIVSLGHEVTGKKVYEKQKNPCLKGDWEDFALLGVDMDKNLIKNTPDYVNRKRVKV